MSSRVFAAFLLLGFLNAGTPLEIASTPVSAAQPEENARRNRKPIAMAPSWPKPSSGRMVSGALSASGRSPEILRKTPNAAIPSTLAMKR